MTCGVEQAPEGGDGNADPGEIANPCGAIPGHADAGTEQSQQQGAALLRLETGIYQTEAIGLYERFGFQPIPPFGAYQLDPLSLFYEKRLA